MSKNKRVQRTVGDILSIPLNYTTVAFGMVLDDPLMAFFDFQCEVSNIPPVEAIIVKPVA